AGVLVVPGVGDLDEAVAAVAGGGLQQGEGALGGFGGDLGEDGVGDFAAFVGVDTGCLDAFERALRGGFGEGEEFFAQVGGVAGVRGCVGVEEFAGEAAEGFVVGIRV